jgi:hypothetical protein
MMNSLRGNVIAHQHLKVASASNPSSTVMAQRAAPRIHRRFGELISVHLCQTL